MKTNLKLTGEIIKILHFLQIRKCSNCWQPQSGGKKRVTFKKSRYCLSADISHFTYSSLHACESGQTNRFLHIKQNFSSCKCQVPSDLLDGIWNSVTHFSLFTCCDYTRLPHRLLADSHWCVARVSTWLSVGAGKGEQTRGSKKTRGIKWKQETQAGRFKLNSKWASLLNYKTV